MDDTCLYSDTITSAFQDMFGLLKTCAENGVILDPTKFQFCTKEVEFAGLTHTGQCQAVRQTNKVDTGVPDT